MSSLSHPLLGEAGPRSAALHDWAQIPARTNAYPSSSLQGPSRMPTLLRIVGKHEEDHFSQDELAVTKSSLDMPGTAAATRQRRKRAKTGVKIKRNRKITSCLACRERKQKVSFIPSRHRINRHVESTDTTATLPASATAPTQPA